MARSPLARTASIKQIPAPVGGWNARDPLPEMAATDAVILENMIPGSGGVSLRGGSLTRNTGAPGPVNTLMRYFPPAGSQRLFAASGTGFYDVTSGGVFGAALVSGLASDRWQSVNFGTPGGQFLIAASGFDQPRIFNGSTSTWSPMVINATAGYSYTLDPTKLMAPFVFANRLWFIERGTLRVWYLPIYAIQAPSGGSALNSAQVIDFGSLCTLGGSLVAMADWTRDGGTGSDDYAVLITSAGQVLVYSGTNPNDASSFGLVGVFRIPPPIGQRCVIRAGADLAILTQTGVVPLSSELALTLSQSGQVAITDKIRGAFALAYAGAPNSFGWEMAEYPKGALLIVNVPQASGASQQYVMNTLTGAWCNFTGLNAATFALLGDAVLFGTPDGRIVQYDAGSQDDGMPISAVVLPAFSDFKIAGKKLFTMAKVLYTGAKGYRPAIRLAVDYDNARKILPQDPIPAAGTPWDSPWGSPWGPPQGSSDRWQSIRGRAQTATVLMNVVSNNPFRFDHVDVEFETGGEF